MGRKNTTALLQSLRNLMKNQTCGPLNAYIVPSEDAHQSEYIAECDKRRAFISGFTGSRGLAVVTENAAALWTDGRYFLQAEKEMDSNWTLMKENVGATPSVSEWLIKVLPKQSRVGVDPYLITADYQSELNKLLKKNGHTLATPSTNLVDVVWGADKPKSPHGPVFQLPLEFCGKSWNDKLKEIRAKMTDNKAALLVLSSLDEVAWLFNLRGSDIPFVPVFFSYAVVSQSNVRLFIDDVKITPDVRKHLTSSAETVELLPYANFAESLSKLVGQVEKDLKIWLPQNCSYALASLVSDERRLDKQSPLVVMKAVKNQVEMNGMKKAHIKDAVAHCEFLMWLENEIQAGKCVTEIDASDKFEKLREQQKDYYSLSFETISGAGPNGSIIHYTSSPETNTQIKKDQLYLIDSGAQYKDGTTDVTRTVCFSEPTIYQKECFTRVFKGHASMSMLKLPEGVSGYRLDSISRVALWEVGLEFRHGTGHGVGHFLCVHEGPSGFSFRPNSYMGGINAGMVITIEPGFYEDGQFGIRIENCCALVPVETKFKYQDVKFLTFEPLTLVPIQAKMVDVSLLTKRELDWLNNYHQTCLKTLTPELIAQGKTEVLEWLKIQCRTINSI